MKRHNGNKVGTMPGAGGEPRADELKKERCGRQRGEQNRGGKQEELTINADLNPLMLTLCFL